jgi:hypothetical protein
VRPQVLVEFRLGERRVGAKVEWDLHPRVPAHDRGDEVLPAVGTVDVPGAELRGFAIAELVEGEDRVVAAALEVAVVGRLFLLSVDLHLGTVDVDDDPVGLGLPGVGKNPEGVQGLQLLQVLLCREDLGLEPAPRARTCKGALDVLDAGNHPHGRVVGQALGIVHVLVSSDAAVDGLAEELEEVMADVLARPRLLERHMGHQGKVDGPVQFGKG